MGGRVPWTPDGTDRAGSMAKADLEAPAPAFTAPTAAIDLAPGSPVTSSLPSGRMLWVSGLRESHRPAGRSRSVVREERYRLSSRRGYPP